MLFVLYTAQILNKEHWGKPLQHIYFFYFVISQLAGSNLVRTTQPSSCLKACSHDPILRIRFLVPQIGSRRSDGPISRFRFCGENVGRSFVVCSHYPISRTNKEFSVWHQNDDRDIMQNLSAPFIFQEECRMKIEHVLFPSVFLQLWTVCWKVIFNVFTLSDFQNQQKSDP